jgi:hypothetical protein
MRSRLAPPSTGASELEAQCMEVNGANRWAAQLALGRVLTSGPACDPGANVEDPQLGACARRLSQLANHLP